ncbi:glycerophosphocholine cholinephosphodiesterase ENPP6-like isoform X2 [Oratosquilla oratoria]
MMCVIMRSATVSMLVLSSIVVLTASGSLAQDVDPTTTPATVKRNKLFCILLDGFRWDYIDRKEQELPGFSRFLKEGVRAAWLNPPFPSVSYPAWTTIVTGQYPETHGIVDNFIYDNVEKELFGLQQEAVSGKEKWWTSEPLWTTATLANLEVAVIRWGRCDVGIKGTYPEFCTPYHGDETFRERLDKGIDKLNEGFDLAMVYFGDVDDAGHINGPESSELKETVARVDSNIEYLQNRLEELGLNNNTNIVILSDHGMTLVQPAENVTFIEITEFLNINLVDYICGSETFMNIKVPKENVDEVYKQLEKMEGTDVYRREDIPENLHIKNNKYINEIVVIAHPGVVVLGSRNVSKQLSPRGGTFAGIHGYDPDFMDMKGIFFAKGPDFVKNKMIPPINMVDVYQVLTKALQLEPKPHNGTWEHVTKLFQDSPPEEFEMNGNTTLLAIILVIVAGFLLLGLAWRLKVKERCTACRESYNRNI